MQQGSQVCFAISGSRPGCVVRLTGLVVEIEGSDAAVVVPSRQARVFGRVGVGRVALLLCMLVPGCQLLH